MKVDRRIFAGFDWTVFGLGLLIPTLGLVVLYSAGYDPENPTDLFGFMQVSFPSQACLKQSIYLAVGLAVMLVGMSIPTQALQRYAYVVYGVGIALLVAVATVGTVVNGSQRWLDLGGINLQPSEFMKLGMILTLARVLSKFPPKDGSAYKFTELFLPMAVVFLPMGLIIEQPDLGTAMSLGVVGAAQILFVGVRPRTIGIALAAVLALSYPAWHSLHDYQQRRVLVLLDPEVDPQGSGYHITQSKIAVGSGALFGKGFLQGTQTQLEFLPEHTTDFVFSVLAEEWGFIGCLILVLLLFGLVAAMLRVVHRSRDMFSCLLAFGITAKFFAHSIINIGMVVGLMPVVGIPLPLVSYGGSSMMSLMFALGIVQGVSMRRMVFRAGG